MGARVLGWARRTPFTLAVVAAMLVLGVATGALWSPLEGTDRFTSVAYGLPAFEAGRWATVVSGAFFALVPLQYVAVAGGFLVLCGFAELRLGTARAALAVVVSQVAGVLLAAGLLRLVDDVGWAWATATAQVLDVGFSAGAVGAAAAASATLRVPWRGRLRFVLLAYCLVNLLYVGALWDVEHMIAVLLGLAIGPPLAGRPYQRPALHRMGRREWRLLAAGWAFFVAAGTLLSSYLPGDGPLGDPGASTDGGAGWVGVVGAALLLLLADGLRRGRRVAWRWTVALCVIVLLVVVWPPYTPDQVYNGLLMGGLLVVLLVGRFRVHAFAVRGDQRAARRVLLVLLGVLVALSVYAWLGFRLIDGFSPPVSGDSGASEVLSRLLLGTSGMVEPTTPLASAFLASLTLLWWVALVGALVLVLWSNRRPPSTGRDAVVALLQRHGGGDLSWMTTWPGNEHWFAPDGDATVAYRVHAGVAVGLADPVCAPDRLGATVAGFADDAEARGLLPCLFSVGEDTAEAARALGWSALQVAEEAVVPLPDLEFRGKAWQDVRSALNRAGKEGVRFELGRLDAMSFGTVMQVRAISEEWVGDKGLPEMGFTLGGVDEALDPLVDVGLAIDAGGTVQGVTSWLPVYAPGGEIVGRTLDVMRRGDGSFRPVTEFLIASAALAYRDQGLALISLSGAPLAHADEDAEPGVLDRLLDLLGETLEPYYGFRSLHQFKAKFQPENRPMYLVYPDDAALPRIGVAIGRAYLPDAGIGDLMALVRPPEHSSG